MNFSAVILAGGQSRRMGRDKAWLKRDGKTLLERQVELVRFLGVTEIFISGRRTRTMTVPACGFCVIAWWIQDRWAASNARWTRRYIRWCWCWPWTWPK